MAIINFTNFIDGIDGLCSSIFLIPLLFIIFILFNQSRYNEIELFLTLFIVVLIFLIINLGIIKSLKIQWKNECFLRMAQNDFRATLRCPK